MQVLFSSAISLVVGFIVGSFVTYFLLEQLHQRKTVKEYERKIQELKEGHQKAIQETRITANCDQIYYTLK